MLIDGNMLNTMRIRLNSHGVSKKYGKINSSIQEVYLCVKTPTANGYQHAFKFLTKKGT